MKPNLGKGVGRLFPFDIERLVDVISDEFISLLQAMQEVVGEELNSWGGGGEIRCFVYPSCHA